MAVWWFATLGLGLAWGLDPALRQVVDGAREASQNASKQAAGILSELFDTHLFRLELALQGGGKGRRLASLPTDVLLAEVEDALKSLEWVTNFGLDVDSLKQHPGESALSIDTVDAFGGRFPGIWELKALNSSVVANVSSNQWGILEAAEQGLYGLPPFQHFGEPTATESRLRPRYLAGNMRQLDLGVQRYGAMVAVLRSDVVRHRAVVVGTDSGGWESCCNKSVTPVHKQSWIEKLLEELSLHCGPAASTPLGVSEMHLHSFLANTRTFHTVGGGAARLTYQLLEEGADVRPIEGNMYTEAALLGDFVVDDVKVLVGSFPGLFGSELGDKLRSFCLRHGVPLAWGLGNSRPWPVEEKQLLDWLPMEPFEYWHGAGVRLLDPIAGWALTNSTQGGGAETLAVWKQVWTQIAHERQVRNGGLTRAEFQTWWQHIAVQDYPVKGLRGAGCPDDVCFGTIEAGGKRDCVCRATVDGSSKTILV